MFRLPPLPLLLLPVFAAMSTPFPSLATNTIPLRVREPAVAGLFYPRDPAELARTVRDLLAAAGRAELPGELKALVCPHAGYTYSGPVAAAGYKLAAGGPFDTVIVLAPSHYAGLAGASVSGADVFRTPLGDVPLSPKARELGRLPPFALDAPAAVQRPDWAAQSSRPRAAPGAEDADTWEHADEVQVPFIQVALPGCALVPVVFGDVDPAQAAAALAAVLDDRTLVVVSTDLSHFDTADHARLRDRRCLDAVCALDADAIRDGDACGAGPLRALLHLARARGWRAQLLDYRNSGDTTGDTSRVVGYGAVAFYAPAAAGAAEFGAADRARLLGIAREALRECTATGRLPQVEAAGLDAKFTAPRACFVTLTLNGALRGCIGHLAAHEPLYRAVAENTRNAALHDPRFPAVSAAEAGGLEIEISVLTPARPLAFASPEELLAKLRPGVDGVILQIGRRTATFLPQVWEQLPDKAAFLGHLAQKAGCEPDAWRGPGVQVQTYQVEAFTETGHR